MNKFSENKVMRDPLHHYIQVEHPLIWDLINTKEFQRLRRIRQLSGAYLVFHTAEHSRFGHCLGVYEIIRRMVKEINDLSQQLTEEEKLLVMVAGLLHDIGHGPFSHAFEAVAANSHEEMTKQLILGESGINSILKAYDSNLPKQIAAIIDHSHPNKLLIQLISSQLDADRMDYLLRDSYFTGAKYGEFDLERILRTLKVVDNQLVVKESGIHTVEDYIMSRYHMYWQVYYHATIRSFEAILVLLFQRLRDLDLKDKYPMFAGLYQGQQLTNQQHFQLDDYNCFYGFSQMCDDEDPILCDLAERLVNRRLFGYQSVPAEAKIGDYLHLAPGLDSRYYLYIDSASQVPYLPYLSQAENLIKVLLKNGEIVELSEVSKIVKAMVSGENKEDYKLFYPQ